MEDFACYFKSKDSQDFTDYLADRDIKWELDVLRRVSGTDQVICS